MATRSLIILEEEKQFKTIYAHWDGYLENNGVILQENYLTQNEVSNLIFPGDISALQKTVGEKHPFSLFDETIDAPTLEIKQQIEDDYNDKYAHMTTYYARDRGDSERESISYNTATEALNANMQGNIEFAYLFQNNEWHVASEDSKWEFSPLTQALAKDNISFTMPEEKNFTVWVGGSEVNDYLVSHSVAQELATSFIEEYEDDVVIDRIIDESPMISPKP